MFSLRFCFSFFFLGVILLPGIEPLYAQDKFTKQDTLRGSITPERNWWDLIHYDLSLQVFPKKKYIEGYNIIRYQVLHSYQKMQIDLQPPLQVYKVTQAGKNLKFQRKGNIYYIYLQDPQREGKQYEISIYYKGHPVEAKRPPWDGGFTWSKDNRGRDFIATSCQGLGASVWWPCKDHMYDEPDEGMDIHITVPSGLVGVANGKLKSVREKIKGFQTYSWVVINPINNYGVNVNIANYVHFSHKYHGEKGVLDCDYYVLEQNLEKAKKQFEEVPRMLTAFEYWFGPYPFYEDSFKLVEVPYLGMEHQSSVTYGNGYQNGYRGKDLSGSGWGEKFDFIIIHEAGHEWFANNITYKDIADMWIHESFTAYSENLFLDYHYGKKASAQYVRGTRAKVINDKPVIGPYGVNKEGSKDMYYKGANMLHTLRQVINNDEKWRYILRSLNKTFYHQTVTTHQIESYISALSGINLTPFFDQYLRDIRIPVLEYKMLPNGKLKYRWTNCIKAFDMKVRIFIGDHAFWIHPSTKWQSKKISNLKTAESITIDPNFYIEYRKLN